MISIPPPKQNTNCDSAVAFVIIITVDSLPSYGLLASACIIYDVPFSPYECGTRFNTLLFIITDYESLCMWREVDAGVREIFLPWARRSDVPREEKEFRATESLW